MKGKREFMIGLILVISHEMADRIAELERELAEARAECDRTLAEIKRCLLALGGTEDRPVAVLVGNEYLADAVGRVVRDLAAARAEVERLTEEGNILAMRLLQSTVELDDTERAARDGFIAKFNAAWSRYQQEREGQR